MSTDLSLPQRAAVALNSSQHEAELLALASKYADITEIVNGAGRDQAHGAMMELANRRVAITKAGKDARDDATKFGKAIIEEERRLVSLIEPEEGRLRGLRDTWDAEREREKQAKAAAEKARVDGIRKRIAEIQAIPAMLVGKQSETIAAAIESLEAVAVTLEDFTEFAGEAEMVKIAAVAKLGEMLTAQLAAEAEAKRLQAEREELARLRAEAEERERQAAAQRAAQEKADREARDAEEAKLRQQREAHEAELRRQREAEEAKLAEQRAEIARAQAEIDRQRTEAERVERERLAAIEAEEQRKRDEADAAERTEAERIRAEEAAAVAEQIRREQKQFAANGPGDVEIVKFLADQYDVEIGDVMGWMKKFDYDAADEYFAAENVKRAA